MTGSSKHRFRLALASAAAIVTAAALASAGLAGLRALDLGSAAAKQYPGKKVTICHRTHSKKHRWVKIRVSRHALRAHLHHGDFVVDADHPCPPSNEAAAKHKHNKHNHKHGEAKKKHKGEAQKEHGKGGRPDHAGANGHGHSHGK